MTANREVDCQLGLILGILEMDKKTITPMRRRILVLAIATALGGCAVQPVKMSAQDMLAQSDAAKVVLDAESAQVDGVIDLNEAFARTIKYNRQSRLKVFESVVAQGQLDVDRFDMLPELTLQAGYTERDNYAATTVASFTGDSPDPIGSSPSYSVSSDKDNKTSSVGFTWDILDFGLSYYRAQQQSDRYLIAKEQERKVIHTLMSDVRKAYYRAVSAERLLVKIKPLIERARAALKNSRKIEELQAQSPLQALTYQRDLLETLRTLQSIRSDLMPAKAELATLMGMNPGEAFELAGVEDASFDVPEMTLDVAAMERTALVQRPELVEAGYQQRITQSEVQSAFLNLFPSLSLSVAANYDGSDYVKNNDWISAGSQVSWNLMSLFKYGSLDALNKLKVEAAKQQALATSMAVISQVHIANLEFHEDNDAYELSTAYLDVATRIKDQVAVAMNADSSGELELIKEDLNLLLAELRRDVAYADLQNSFGRIMVTMGMDPLPEGFGEMDLKSLTAQLDERFSQWQKGEIELVDEVAESTPEQITESPTEEITPAVSSQTSEQDSTPVNASVNTISTDDA